MARGDKDEGGNVPMASDGCGVPWSVVTNKEDHHRQEALHNNGITAEMMRDEEASLMGSLATATPIGVRNRAALPRPIRKVVTND